MPGEFQGKVVVVTGGSRGIGRAIGAAFAREGAQVALAASNAGNLAEAVKVIGGAPLTVAADLRTLDGCKAVFEAVNAKFGRCDILVNSAGATKAGNFLEQPDDAWVDGFALKFFGAVRITRLFWPLLKQSHGSVVNIIGGAAKTPSAGFLIGGAVNAAFANFSKGLAELGNRDDVNVNVIHPGMTETDRNVQLFEQHARAQNKTPDEIRKDMLEKSATRRFGQPEDIAEAVLFLASAKARHVQGAALVVDGGTTKGLY